LRELYQQLLEAGAAAGPGEGSAGYAQGYDQGPAPVGLLSLLGGGAGAGAGAGLPLANHQLVRKSNRTPSLRLRYGRRSDPAMKSSCFDGPVDES
ncbi:RYamide C-terminal, partial [Frankliniella occidentalis]